MKNKLILIILCCGTVSTACFSQNKTYTFNKTRTSQVLQTFMPGSFEVYKVSYKEVSIPLYDTINTLTPEYAQLKNDLDKLSNDSAAYTKKHQTELEKYNDMEKAAKNIDDFANSSQKYKDKSHLLAEAQATFTKYNLDYWVYADNNINSDKKREFNMMRLSESNFSNHLRKAYSKVASTLSPDNKADRLSYSFGTIRSKMNRIQKFQTSYKENGKTKQIKAYIIDSKVEDLTLIEGVFTIIGQFYALQENTVEYIKDQLVEKSVIDKQLRDRTFNPLLYNSAKNEYYFDASSQKFTYECGINQEVSNALNLINKAGYKTSYSKSDYTIQTVNGSIVLTPDIIEQVKQNNIKYINDISLSVKTFNSLMVTAKPLTDKIVNHFNAYRSLTMTHSRLSVWKQDVINADGILKKANSLKGAEQENLYNFNNQIAIDKLRTYNDLTDVVNGSKTILGL